MCTMEIVVLLYQMIRILFRLCIGYEEMDNMLYKYQISFLYLLVEITFSLIKTTKKNVPHRHISLSF